MKSLAVSDRYGWSRYVSHQAYYSLSGREYEWELMPLALDQKVGTIVWSPLAGGRLTGKIRPGQPIPQGTRIQQIGYEAPPITDELFQSILDALDAVAAETGKTVAQVALNWVINFYGEIVVAIPGASKPSQAEESAGAQRFRLADQELERLEELSR